MLKPILKILIAGLLLIIGFILGSRASLAEAPQPTEQDKFEIALDEWITRLSICESGGRQEIVNPADGGSPSYGLVQYKIDTFIRYSELYNVFPSLTKANVMSYIMSGENQRVLTKEILRNKPSDARNWTNCTNKIGKPPVL